MVTYLLCACAFAHTHTTVTAFWARRPCPAPRRGAFGARHALLDFSRMVLACTHAGSSWPAHVRLTRLEQSFPSIYGSVGCLWLHAPPF